MKIIKVFVEELVDYLGEDLVRIEGDFRGVFIDNLSDVEHTNETTLDWINPSKINKQEIAERSKAKVILVDNEVFFSELILQEKKILLFVDDPKLALANIGKHFFVPPKKTIIHPSAIIDSSAIIGEDVCIEPFAVIGNAMIGDGCVISSNVKIYDDVVIGTNCYIKEGAVIGGPGFGFEIDKQGNRFRFPQLGRVLIGNNVEIGSNTCVDRGALSDTIIDDYAKIDNLCHIAHNVHIGKNTMITACSEISGSCHIGDNAWIGPNTSVRDWRNIGNNAFLGMGSNVVKDVPDNEVWAGNPAKFLINTDLFYE